MKIFNSKIVRSFVLIFLLMILPGCNEKKDSALKPSKIYTDFLKNTSWIISNDRLIGIEPRDSVYHLTLKSDTAQIWNFSAVNFQDDRKFTSFNSWECGNDCFTATFGTYKFIKINEIVMMTDSITTTGTCEAPTKIIKNKIAESFKVVKDQNKITLKKIK